MNMCLLSDKYLTQVAKHRPHEYDFMGFDEKNIRIIFGTFLSEKQNHSTC